MIVFAYYNLVLFCEARCKLAFEIDSLFQIRMETRKNLSFSYFHLCLVHNSLYLYSLKTGFYNNIIFGIEFVRR